jgi:ABC-type uncharacterized transport system permease subunit
MDTAKERIGVWPIAIYSFVFMFMSTFVTPLLIQDDAPFWKHLVVSIVGGIVFGCLLPVAVKVYDRLKRNILSS